MEIVALLLLLMLVGLLTLFLKDAGPIIRLLWSGMLLVGITVVLLIAINAF